MPMPWPLTGRTPELDAAVAALRRNGTGGVLLAGGAGVGKTRLAREILGRLAGRGTAGRWVAATSASATVPLGCLAHLMPGGGSVDPAAALDRVAHELHGRGPTVLAVDDAHLLDAVSAGVVHQLAAHHGVPMVITLRTGEPVPDAVTVLWKDGHLDRVELEPLPRPDTVALLEAVLGGPVEGSSAERLWRVTRGNPLYLQHIVDGERAAGHLLPVGGVWRWRGDPALRPRLIELVESRVGSVPADVNRVLELLAYGEPLDPELLGRLAGRAAVEAAEDRGLVVVRAAVRGHEAVLAHPLYAEVVRARTGTLRARRVRGELVGLLGDHRGVDPLRIAVLAVDSDRPPEPAVLTRAAHQARDYLDLDLARRLAEAGWTAGAGFEAALLLGVMTSHQGRAGAEPAFAEAARLAVDDAEHVELALARAVHAFRTGPDSCESERILGAATARIADPALRARLAAGQASIACWSGRLADAEQLARGVVATPEAPDHVRGLALLNLMGVLAVRGRADEVTTLSERARAVLDRATMWPTWIAIDNREILALRLAGRIDEAERITGRHARQAAAGQVGAVVGFLRGHVAMARGLLGTARRALHDAVTGLTGSDPAFFVFWSRLRLAQVLGMAGDAPGAAAVLADIDADPCPQLGYSAPERWLARAWVAAAEGATSEALAHARTAADVARDGDQPAVEVLALLTAVQFGDQTVVGRLARLARLVDGPAAVIATEHATALAAADGPGLLGASRRWTEIGMLLVAADAAAQASGAFRRAGLRGSAATAAARAHDLAQQCEGAGTPALRATAAPLPLTDREREIAGLVAAGLSNRAIADRLVVSVRTIEGHVLRACRKLDVPDRSALGALLGR